MQTHQQRARTTAWPFAPLTEAQQRAQAIQACSLRNAERRAHHARMLAARAALLALATCSLQACGGGGDWEDDAHTPTPAVRCQQQPEVCA